jgi:hypothetical protein
MPARESRRIAANSSTRGVAFTGPSSPARGLFICPAGLRPWLSGSRSRSPTTRVSSACRGPQPGRCRSSRAETGQEVAQLARLPGVMLNTGLQTPHLVAVPPRQLPSVPDCCYGWASRQAGQMAGRRRPRSGTTMPVARAHARISAVGGDPLEGAAAVSGAPAGTPRPCLRRRCRRPHLCGP